MPKGIPEKNDSREGPTRTSKCQPTAHIGLAHFKYYIHDSISNCRLQLIGSLSAGEIAELSGCWRTAKTTLGQRRLYLDLRGLRNMDEAGKEWIINMAAEGAICIPETFLRDRLAGERMIACPSPKNGVLSRLLSVFRGNPVPGTE